MAWFSINKKKDPGDNSRVLKYFFLSIFSKEEKTTGFIFAFDKTVDEMLSCIEKAKDEVQYIYIVIDDDSKYQRLKKIVPEFCGFFCYSNAFGMGMVMQIKRYATIIL